VCMRVVGEQRPDLPLDRPERGGLTQNMQMRGGGPAS
jgi:hypothetical protein